MRKLALVLALVVATLPASAQESVGTTSGAPETKGSTRQEKRSDGKKPVVKQTIVVTATRSERALSDVPLSTTVVTKEQIQSAPVTTVDDLLRTIPGLNMPLGSSRVLAMFGERFSMHGLGGNRTLVMLDGIPMHDPYYGTVIWQKVPLDSLQQIEVVSGGNASLFGNHALGGTVNLITRPVSTSEVRADLSGGSFTTKQGMMTVDQRLSDRVGVRLSYDRLSTDGYYIAVAPGPNDTTVWNDTAITRFRTDFQPSDRTYGFAKTDWSKIDMGGGTALSRIDMRILDLMAAVHHAVGDRGLVSVTAYHEDERDHLISTSNIGTPTPHLSNDSVVPSKTTGGSVEWTAQRDGQIAFVSAGIDLQQVEATETRQAYAPSGAMTQEDVLNGRQQTAGLYGQASWRPNDRLELLASARLDYFRNENGSDAVTGGDTTIYPSTTSTELDPRVSLRYSLGSHSALRAAVYRAFQAPTLRELYRNLQTGNTFILGNPYLTPETLVGGEIGWEWALARVHVDVNAFRSDVDGYQLRAHVPGAAPNIYQNMNVGKARSQGVSVSGDLRLTPHWSATAGYTYTDATIVENADDPTLVGKMIPEVAPQIGSLGVRYRGDDGLMIDVRGRVLSRMYGEPANLRPSPAHRVVDVMVSRPIGSWVDLYAKGANIFDERYYYVLTAVTSRATEPRSLSFGARIHVPTRDMEGR